MNRVMQREAVGDVPAGAVDVEGDGLAVVVGELAQTLDRGFGAVLLDVPDEIDVAESIRLLLPERVADGIDELAEQTIIELAHGGRVFHSACRNLALLS